MPTDHMNGNSQGHDYCLELLFFIRFKRRSLIANGCGTGLLSFDWQAWIMCGFALYIVTFPWYIEFQLYVYQIMHRHEMVKRRFPLKIHLIDTIFLIAQAQKNLPSYLDIARVKPNRISFKFDSCWREEKHYSLFREQ